MKKPKITKYLIGAEPNKNFDGIHGSIFASPNINPKSTVYFKDSSITRARIADDEIRRYVEGVSEAYGRNNKEKI